VTTKVKEIDSEGNYTFEKKREAAYSKGEGGKVRKRYCLSRGGGDLISGEKKGREEGGGLVWRGGNRNLRGDKQTV